MPYSYSGPPETGDEEPWSPPPGASFRRRGRGFWTVVGSTAAVVVAGIIFAVLTLSAGSAAFTAGGLADHYPAGSFEAIRLSPGDLYFAQISADNGLVVLTDVYYIDPATGRLVQGHPDSAPGSSPQARATAGRYGTGSPVVVDPGQIVTVEPVDPSSPIGREIAASEAQRARLRPMTPTTRVPGGFQ